MKTVIIVSKCLKVIRSKTSDTWYQFHFKGVCAGEVLKKVTLKGKGHGPFIKGEEYLLYVQIISCLEGELRGNVLRSKRLEDCWDKS